MTLTKAILPSGNQAGSGRDHRRRRLTKTVGAREMLFACGASHAADDRRCNYRVVFIPD
jgi:hypothetical protein